MYVFIWIETSYDGLVEVKALVCYKRWVYAANRE